MIPGPASDNIESGTESLEGGVSKTVIGNFIINVVLSGSLQYLWGLINALQIVFHLPGNSVDMPANTKMVYGSLITVTQFNIIPEDWLAYFKFWKVFDNK